jgi:hypothetical protein
MLLNPVMISLPNSNSAAVLMQVMVDVPIEARTVAAQCYLIAGGRLGPAFRIWKAYYKGSKAWWVGSGRHLIRYWGPRLMASGSVQNKPPVKKPRIIPDEVAKQCAVTLKQGYPVWLQPRDLRMAPVEVRRYWTSIKTACAESEQLASVLRLYHATPNALLRRMHGVDPGLKWRRLKIKWDLNAQQKQERQTIAAQLLHLVRTVPNFIERIFFIDECSIWLTSNNVDVHVYADAHDANVSEVMHIPGLGPGVKIKVKVFAVVNVLLGPVFLDFTTGTTGLQRRHIHPTEPFRVSQGLDLHKGDGAVPADLQGLGFRLNPAQVDCHMTDKYCGICLNIIASLCHWWLNRSRAILTQIGIGV